MQTVYRSELERHLASLTSEEAELVTTALQKVTGSTCDAEREAATAAVR
jgi:hypothetical protein